jgi:hypothetical protein
MRAIKVLIIAQAEEGERFEGVVVPASSRASVVSSTAGEATAPFAAAASLTVCPYTETQHADRMTAAAMRARFSFPLPDQDR